MADRPEVLSWVAVAGDPLTHALLTVDAERGRTVCGQRAGRVPRETPRPAQRCPRCWADWRVRGDELRYRRTRR